MSDLKYILIALIISILGPFASDSYLPSLPQMTEYFNTSENVIQFSITAYFLGLACFQLLWGPFSDKLGRKKALQCGGVIALIGCGIAGLAISPLMLNIGRFIQGAGGAASASLSRSILRDRFTGTRLAQVAGISGIFFALVPSIAPLIGGVIQEFFFWRVNFLFLFVLTASILLFINNQYHESNINLNRRALHWDQIRENYKALLMDKPFLGFMISSTCGFAGIVSYYMVSPFLLQDVLGLTPVEYGLTALTLTIGLMTGHITNTLLVHKVGIKRFIKLGFSFMFLGGVLLISFEMAGILTLYSILIPTLFFVIGAAINFSNCSAGAFQPFGHIAGSAAAMYGFLQVLGTTLISFVVSLADDTTGVPLGITYLLLALLGYSAYIQLVEKDACI